LELARITEDKKLKYIAPEWNWRRSELASGGVKIITRTRMELVPAVISRGSVDLHHDVSNLTIGDKSSEWLYSEIIFAAIGLLTIKVYPLVNI
jgi:hypothetical protein